MTRLYHLTGPDTAARIKAEGFVRRDWLAAFDNWGLSRHDTSQAKGVPPVIDRGDVGVAIAERILDDERPAAHPTHGHATFFFPSRAKAREQLRQHPDRVAIVVDAGRVQSDAGRLTSGAFHHAESLYQCVLDAAYEATTVDVKGTREWARSYWDTAYEWTGVEDSYETAEVYATGDVSANAVIDVADTLDAPSQRS